MMDKKTLIAVALSIAIVFGYQFLMAKFYPQKPVNQKPAVTAKEADKKEPQAFVNKEPQPPVVPQPVIPSVAKPAQVVDGEEIKIETELYSAVLSSVGGTVKKWELKKFKDKDGIPVILQGGKSVVPALSIGFDDKFAFADVNYKVLGRDLKLDNNKKTGTIEFQYTAPTYSIKRTYTFYYDSYKFDLKDEVAGLQEYWIAVGSNFGINNTNEDQHVGPVVLKESDRIELSAKKLKETLSYRGGLKWIAQEDKYFFAALVPLNPVEEAKAWAVADPSSVDANQYTGIIAFKSKPGVNSFLVYAGPKDDEILKPLNVELEYIIDFGFFAIVAKPLFWLLKLCYKLLGNYGWAIVLMAILTRLPFIPLLNKSQESMKKMQEIQPKVNEIKEKYKKDPKKMQQEMMEVYKKHKINPVSGCLPILIQLPIFIALYKVLSVAIELRGAPFIFWIADLSIKDPYYVLPVVMGASWFLQQKMMPTPGDPRQAKIMMIMPVIFTFMFLSLASGLVLYWLIGNVLSIIQQYFLNKKLAAKEAIT
jgi:YidC/Oxa1 family membrane protein insertase